MASTTSDQTPSDSTSIDVLSKLQDSALFTDKAYIADEWIKTGKTFAVCEPSSGTTLGRVSDCTLEDFQRAISVASSAQLKFYEQTTATDRGAFLRSWYEHIIANVNDLSIILSLENGKTLAEARGEVIYAANFVSWFAEEATRSYGHTIPSSMPHTTLISVKEPVGVCGIITPWNFPAAMITRKIAPAFAAGCAVVIKPPSETPFTALALSKLAEKAGIFPGILHVLPTKDRSAATELATSPLVNKISFTGSTGVGKMLAKLAAGTLKKVSLELGGNAPFIVFDDADLDLAVEGAMICKFRCSGQTCVCANRIFVQKGVVAAFTRKLKDAVSDLKMGSGLDPATTQGPLVNEAAVTKVLEHIEDAVSKGAKVEYGGKRPSGPGFFCEPTILTSVRSDMNVSQEETFGPLAAVFEFDTEEEVIELSNSTPYGLAGYFFSRDVGRCTRVSRKLQVGMVGINTGKISAAEAPFGGVKESGYGREGSLYGLSEYQVIKSITTGNLDK
ncbi:aldehyde dehydrogenase [Aureobasidium pullulans EXF-150]|uniref:Succinate-semialdehyde dehydrogenase, mitochondrial n=2 Tax=Aureobasidium pullulans TaxID=5580 RepID=A0A074XLS9_AURPU|nr:aldehyde dehydrogenase [Aureobasidium pullulans EXF-150]KEQ82972.1 aldehyde dehydrogenase [Aureobasidium pullulans EXF-150]